MKRTIFAAVAFLFFVHPVVGAEVDVGFSPDGGSQTLITSTIESAKLSAG